MPILPGIAHPLNGFSPFFRRTTKEIVQDGSSATIGVLADFARQRRLGTADQIQARGRYLAEVAQVDHAAGQLFSGLEARGYMDESLVVVFGDHGEILEEDSGPSLWSW